jgi:hypothetical protein
MVIKITIYIDDILLTDLSNSNHILDVKNVCIQK